MQGFLWEILRLMIGFILGYLDQSSWVARRSRSNTGPGKASACSGFVKDEVRVILTASPG